MGIAPAPKFPERAAQNYEQKSAGNPTRRGPLRFEEGLASDTSVPKDFQQGIDNGYATAPGRPNRNAPVWDKPASETMSERSHLGSASWIEAPTFLSEFSAGSFSNHAEASFETVTRSGGRTARLNPTVVND